MAKILLFVNIDAPERLIAQLGEALSLHFAQQPHTCVQLMQPHPDDLFFVAPANYTRPQAVVEVTVQPGKVLGDIYAALTEVVQGVRIAPSSLVYVVHEKRFIDCPPQAVHYHYLMLKRPEFSVADYNDYYSHFHCRMGFHTPAIAGYSQNYVDMIASQALAERLGLDCHEVTSISEMKMVSLQALASAPELAAIAQPAAEDEERFVDRSRSVSFSSEVVLRIGDFASITDSVFSQHFPPAKT